MVDSRNSRRYPIVVKRYCTMGVIAFKDYEWINHVIHIVDFSKGGVGIEADQAIEPGFVWFKDRVAGQKGGVLVWSRQQGKKFRAGVRLLSLAPACEEFIQKESLKQQTHRPLRGPEAIVAALTASLEKTRKS